MPTASTRPAGKGIRGDEAQLYERHHARLRRSVRGALGYDDELVEDACAFAWTQLLARQPDRSEHLFGWLRKVAIHEGWRLQRQAQRHTPPLSDPDPQQEDRIERTIAEPVDLDLRLQSREAARMLAQLHPRQARYLTLLIAGYSYHEIQALDGVTYTAVNRYIRRAWASIRELRSSTQV